MKKKLANDQGRAIADSDLKTIDVKDCGDVLMIGFHGLPPRFPAMASWLVEIDKKTDELTITVGE